MTNPEMTPGAQIPDSRFLVSSVGRYSTIFIGRAC